MSTSDSKSTPESAESSSNSPATRRGRVPGPEAGFGRRLREARGIEKQAEISERAEIARSALARYERGDRFPSVPELRRLCEALSVTPEHLIFGRSSPGFEPSPSPIAAAAPGGDSEKARIARHVLTGVLLNALPKNESDAFRELIWASASQHLRDQPDALEAISRICSVMTESIWDDIDSLIEQKFESEEKLKEIVNTLSDTENDNS